MITDIQRANIEAAVRAFPWWPFNSGKSWLQDVNGVETAVIGVTDAAKLLSGLRP